MLLLHRFACALGPSCKSCSQNILQTSNHAAVFPAANFAAPPGGPKARWGGLAVLAVQLAAASAKPIGFDRASVFRSNLTDKELSGDQERFKG